MWEDQHLMFNTSYFTDSYIIFTLKMESVSKITTFGLQMTVESGLEKILLKFLHAQAIFYQMSLPKAVMYNDCPFLKRDAWVNAVFFPNHSTWL